MRFASLGSGSRGNATVVQSETTTLLLDCGFPARELERRIAGLGIEATQLDAIVVTHEHGDHLRGVGPLARRYGMPVWMTHGTHRGGSCGQIPRLELFSSHAGALCIGDIELMPCAVPHDACEPSQFVFQSAGRRLGILTDLGSLTPVIIERLGGLDALLLECNHDPQLLREGPYPPSLQARVGGDYGHLSNDQAAGLLQRIDTGGLSCLVIGHLSEKNNRPELARAAVCGVCSHLADRLSILAQDTVSDWFEI